MPGPSVTIGSADGNKVRMSGLGFLGGKKLLNVLRSFKIEFYGCFLGFSRVFDCFFSGIF